MLNLKELIPSYSDNKLLPLIHCTDFFSFREILNSSKLETTLCTVFDKELLYMFYGRPAYRVSSGVNCFTNSAYLPVAFLFEATNLTGIEQIYPFDTGAFNNGIFKSFIHPKSKLQDFELDKNVEQLSSFVEYFYGKNANYYLGRAKEITKHYVNNIELETYYDIIRSTGNSEIDDRKYTIEISLNQAISLEGVVSNVILPISLINEDILSKISISWKANIHNYPDIYGGNIDIQNGALRARVYDILKEGGYFV